VIFGYERQDISSQRRLNKISTNNETKDCPTRTVERKNVRGTTLFLGRKRPCSDSNLDQQRTWCMKQPSSLKDIAHSTRSRYHLNPSAENFQEISSLGTAWIRQNVPSIRDS